MSTTASRSDRTRGQKLKEPSRVASEKPHVPLQLLLHGKGHLQHQKGHIERQSDGSQELWQRGREIPAQEFDSSGFRGSEMQGARLQRICVARRGVVRAESMRELPPRLDEETRRRVAHETAHA